MKYDEAINSFYEGILLLPKLDMYAEELKRLYWQRAECYLRKVTTLIYRSSVQYSRPVVPKHY